jgi:hypothetical protein
VTLKNGKAAGLDNIPVAIKADDRDCDVTILHNLFSKILEKEEIAA